MNRIQDYSKLQFDIDKWIKDYYYFHGIQSLVVGVSGGIDSAVVSTLCAKTGLPTYVIAMPLNSTHQNTRLSDLHTKQLAEKYDNVRVGVTYFAHPDADPVWLSYTKIKTQWNYDKIPMQYYPELDFEGNKKAYKVLLNN